MHSDKPTFAIPVPKHLPEHLFLQPHPAIQAPWPGPSPVSTPGLSDETSETLAEEVQYYGTARCDEEGLAQSLDLPDEIVASEDMSIWEAHGFSVWLAQRCAEEAKSAFFESTSDTTATRRALNPNAGEFVPSSARAIGPDASEDEKQVDHPWMEEFSAGTATTNAKVRKECARTIVVSHLWNAKTMQELTERFITRVRDHSGQDLVQIACFAKAMSNAFGLCAGGATSGYFRIFLMQSLLNTFAALWQEGSPTSFLSFPHQNPAAQTRFSPKALTPALTVAAFIPELFTQNLVHVGFVFQCLHLLVDNMCWIEQLRGARALLCRLDYRAADVDSTQMRQIMRTIKANSARIGPGRSALDAAFGDNDVNIQLEVGAY
ncbi:hypothetical protein GY45DRAFT_1323195 [Cubamyces sp. BRFM 1775]|nr:hypothetical protein GY45DRAFT_1323195 [Cubamyces sp. BRFM 1775]